MFLLCHHGEIAILRQWPSRNKPNQNQINQPHIDTWTFYTWLHFWYIADGRYFTPGNHRVQVWRVPVVAVEHQHVSYHEETESQSRAEQTVWIPTPEHDLSRLHREKWVLQHWKVSACTRWLMREQTSGWQSLGKNRPKVHLHSH